MDTTHMADNTTTATGAGGQPATAPSAAVQVGKVYLVGAGPGDPGLITLRGKYLLERAQVVVYDHLANPKLLKFVPPAAELIYAGKRGGIKHTFTQPQISRMLVEKAQAGFKVVRLKGGDPFIFGRGAEEIEELVKHNIPFEVVPGVTSATAAATYAGIPITHRGYTSSVAFITGHEDPTKPGSNVAWDKLATGAGTIVIYMGIKNLPIITKNLIKYGRDPKTPVAVVRWASTPEQRSVVGTLETISDIVINAKIKPPSLIVVGEVVNLRDKIDWFEKRALFGKRILITRTRDQASELVSLLEEAGANCLEFATISIVQPDSHTIIDQALTDIGRHDWLLFTSLNAVKYFFARLFEKNMDARDLQGLKIGVVGKATADALATYCLKADLIPEQFTGEGLAASLLEQGVQGKKILLPRAQDAREVLVDRLTAGGAEVTVAPVYKNIRPTDQTTALRREFEEKNIDMVTFTSSSTVTNFLKMLGAENQEELDRLLDGVLIAAIGPITANTARKNGLTIHIQPEKHTIPEMVTSIIAHG
jgi:uroporphyrinogen III methyltransferase/synthase